MDFEYFGWMLDLSDDGNTLAISAQNEDSNATGINGDESDNNAGNSGAVYVFSRAGASWKQHAYVKASNTDGNDLFGGSSYRCLALSADGATLAVSAIGEDSATPGINGDALNNNATNSGAVYLY